MVPTTIGIDVSVKPVSFEVTEFGNYDVLFSSLFLHTHNACLTLAPRPSHSHTTAVMFN